MTTKQAWVGFGILSLIWGSSFLFIRIGVEQLPPLQLVFIRTGIAAIGLSLVAYRGGKRLPADWRSMGDLLFLGIVNTVFPFVLITWGETHIESGLASVWQGTAALFTLVVAHFTFADERITWRKLAGLVVGFLGVVVLASRSMQEQVAGGNTLLHLLGQLAIAAASFCYAVGSTYSRKAMKNRLEPIVASAGAMSVAAIITGVIAYWEPLRVGVLGGAAPVAFSQMAPRVLGAVLALGLVNTFGAYLLYYPLIVFLGAARTSMVTYVIPVIGLVLGVIFLKEPIDLRLILGAILILSSIGIVNLNLTVFFKHPPTSSAAILATKPIYLQRD